LPVTEPLAVVEEAAGNPIVDNALTVVGAAFGGIPALFVPILSTTLASEPHRRRTTCAMAC